MPLTSRSLSALKRAHQHLAADTARAVDEASQLAARHAVEHVQRFPEFTPRTGNLQRKTTARVVRTKGGRLIRIANPEKYAPAIDTGARPHVIEGRGGGLLKFRGRGGQWVSKRRVNHPGNRPYKFMYRAQSAAYRVLGQDLARRFADIARRF